MGVITKMSEFLLAVPMYLPTDNLGSKLPRRCIAPTGLNMILSPKTIVGLLHGLPIDLSYADFPSGPILNLVIKNAAWRAIHASIGWLGSICSPSFSSKSESIALTVLFTSLTADSAMPLAGAFSALVDVGLSFK